MEDSKPIKGFEDYLISPAGKVFSLKSNRSLRPGINPWGYYHVVLCKSGNCYNKRIARLVAIAFIPNPESKPQVNHIDGNKLNNDVSNLEWVTRSENQLHAFKTGLQKYSPKSGPPLLPVKVYNYTTGKFLSAHPSQSDAAETYGLSQGLISNVLAGTRNHTGGLTFKRV